MTLRSVFLLVFVVSQTAAFVPLPDLATRPVIAFVSSSSARYSTVEAPTREKTERRTGSRGKTGGERYTEDDAIVWDYSDLEYLHDPAESRELDDPFHILLMGSTFEKPKVTVTYVAGSLEYVLGMPGTEAKELTQFAHDEGMSCLGTWSREECLSLGKQLQLRDIVCRVVPFAEGGHRGWQAKDAGGASRSSGAGAGDGNAFF
jgi:ATP-dependent Clp protease adapter protein ClpS